MARRIGTVAGATAALAAALGLFGNQSGQNITAARTPVVQQAIPSAPGQSAQVPTAALAQLLYAPAVMGRYSAPNGGRHPWIAKCGTRLIRQVT